jgi:DNA-nicking Smr family endonuclease
MNADDKPTRGRRTLSAEERALWRAIARSVKPLRRRRRPEPDDEEPDMRAPGRETAARAPSPAKPVAVRAPKAPTPLVALARRERQKLARGGTPIDARIDLHGMTQAQAHAALARFLQRAQADGARFVLVITGKGARGAEAVGERGVLRRQVPLWLGMPEFRDAVVGFEEAHFAHGGAGALYVRMRRASP